MQDEPICTDVVSEVANYLLSGVHRLEGLMALIAVVFVLIPVLVLVKQPSKPLNLCAIFRSLLIWDIP